MKCLWDRTPISTQIHPQSWQRPLGIPASGTGMSPLPCWKHRDTGSQGKAAKEMPGSLQPQFPPLWGLSGALPLCPAWWGKGLVGSFTLQISLEFSNSCGELTVAEGPRWLLSSPALSVLPSTEALSSGDV